MYVHERVIKTNYVTSMRIIYLAERVMDGDMETVKSVKKRINDRWSRVTYTGMRFVTRSTRFTIPVQRKMSPACP